MAVSEPVALVPLEVTAAFMEDESAALLRCASRWGWAIEIDVDDLVIKFRMSHPADGTPLVLDADLTSYRAIPPAWRFVDDSGSSTPDSFPAPGEKSIFHSNLVICAPWNRLAYKELGGPHDGDWVGPTNWLNITNVTRAVTLPDMAAIVRAHLHASPGMMA